MQQPTNEYIRAKPSPTSRDTMTEQKDIVADMMIARDVHAVHEPDGYVYIASAPSCWKKDLYKIGMTTGTVKDRISALNTSRPINDSLIALHAIRCRNPKELETRIHNMLNRFRNHARREFFRFPLTELIQLCDGMAQRLHDQQIARDRLFAEMQDIPMSHGADAIAILADHDNRT